MDFWTIVFIYVFLFADNANADDDNSTSASKEYFYEYYEDEDPNAPNATIPEGFTEHMKGREPDTKAKSKELYGEGLENSTHISNLDMALHPSKLTEKVPKNSSRILRTMVNNRHFNNSLQWQNHSNHVVIRKHIPHRYKRTDIKNRGLSPKDKVSNLTKPGFTSNNSLDVFLNSGPSKVRPNKTYNTIERSFSSQFAPHQNTTLDSTLLINSTNSSKLNVPESTIDNVTNIDHTTKQSNTFNSSNKLDNNPDSTSNYTIVDVSSVQKISDDKSSKPPEKNNEIIMDDLKYPTEEWSKPDSKVLSKNFLNKAETSSDGQRSSTDLDSNNITLSVSKPSLPSNRNHFLFNPDLIKETLVKDNNTKLEPITYVNEPNVKSEYLLDFPKRITLQHINNLRNKTLSDGAIDFNTTKIPRTNGKETLNSDKNKEFSLGSHYAPRRESSIKSNTGKREELSLRALHGIRKGSLLDIIRGLRKRSKLTYPAKSKEQMFVRFPLPGKELTTGSYDDSDKESGIDSNSYEDFISDEMTRPALDFIYRSRKPTISKFSPLPHFNENVLHRPTSKNKSINLMLDLPELPDINFSAEKNESILTSVNHRSMNSDQLKPDLNLKSSNLTYNFGVLKEHKLKAHPNKNQYNYSKSASPWETMLDINHSLMDSPDVDPHYSLFKNDYSAKPNPEPKENVSLEKESYDSLGETQYAGPDRKYNTNRPESVTSNKTYNIYLTLSNEAFHHMHETKLNNTPVISNESFKVNGFLENNSYFSPPKADNSTDLFTNTTVYPSEESRAIFLEVDSNKKPSMKKRKVKKSRKKILRKQSDVHVRRNMVDNLNSNKNYKQSHWVSNYMNNLKPSYNQYKNKSTNNILHSYQNSVVHIPYVINKSDLANKPNNTKNGKWRKIKKMRRQEARHNSEIKYSIIRDPESGIVSSGTFYFNTSSPNRNTSPYILHRPQVFTDNDTLVENTMHYGTFILDNKNTSIGINKTPDNRIGLNGTIENKQPIENSSVENNSLTDLKGKPSGKNLANFQPANALEQYLPENDTNNENFRWDRSENIKSYKVENSTYMLLKTNGTENETKINTGSQTPSYNHPLGEYVSVGSNFEKGDYNGKEGFNNKLKHHSRFPNKSMSHNFEKNENTDLEINNDNSKKILTPESMLLILFVKPQNDSNESLKNMFIKEINNNINLLDKFQEYTSYLKAIYNVLGIKELYQNNDTIFVVGTPNQDSGKVNVGANESYVKIPNNTIASVPDKTQGDEERSNYIPSDTKTIIIDEGSAKKPKSLQQNSNGDDIAFDGIKEIYDQDFDVEDQGAPNLKIDKTDTSEEENGKIEIVNNAKHKKITNRSPLSKNKNVLTKITTVKQIKNIVETIINKR